MNLKKYKIVSTKKVGSVGDIDRNRHVIYIDKRMPKKYHEGIKVHEIEERKWIERGYSYTQAHAKAEKKELDYYKEKLGKKKATDLLKREEKKVNQIYCTCQRK